MSASQPALFNVQEFTDNGVTLVGGRLYTYAYGTTTQKVAYTDPEGTVPQTYTADGLGGQYIALNARGELPASLYLAAGLYDLTLRRADGSIVWTRQASATVSSTALALPTGADLIGFRAPGAGAILTTVGAALNSLHGIDVTLYGASPTASSAVNTAAINAANLIALASGRPVYFPPIGLIPHDRLQPVAGDLIWAGGADQYAAGVAIGSASWPYASSGLPMLQVTGSFRVTGITFDQKWLTSDHPNANGYRDGYSPRTWGGGFYVEVIGEDSVIGKSSTIVELDRVNFDNVTRGILIKNAALVDVKNTSSNGRDAYAQCVIATSECLEVWIDADLNAMMWNEGDEYIRNGGSGFYSWNCGTVQMTRLICIGHQLVLRGPMAWAPNTNYAVGDEYRAGRISAYRVKTAYTSGASFGATDTAATDEIYYGMKLCVFGYVHVNAPIADTAPYDWVTLIVTHLTIYNSGDMGLATSSCDNVHIAYLHVDGVRIGGLDLSYNVSFSIGSITIRNFARASEGVYSRIDQFGRFASGAGLSLAAVVIGAQVAPGTRSSIMSNVKVEFDTLPPESDPLGPVLAKIFGVFAQPSANPAHYHAITSSACVVPDLGAQAPNFFFAVGTLRFYLQAISGSPIPGDIFISGAIKFILVSTNGATGLVYVRKFVGAGVIAPNVVFTGTNGATLTSAASTQTTFLDGVEAAIFDKSSKFY